MVLASVQFIILPEIATRIINQNYTKEVANQVLRSAAVTAKNHLTNYDTLTNMTPSYQQNIGA